MSTIFSDTIAAISTPTAQSGKGSGLGVIRLSGDSSVKIADRIFCPAKKDVKLADLGGYTALYGYILDGGDMVDECVALVFKAPHSFTGEDVVELSCHGGSYILGKILRIVFENGARPAEAGEFTRRAFLHGKVDLTKAEAIMDLIGAKGELAAKAAISTRKGAVSEKVRQICDLLLGVSAQFLAFVDYPDDDIPELADDELLNVLEKSRAELSTLLATFDQGRILKEGVSAAIVGRPNVGKSTLMNLLSRTDRSIVTNIEGTTRDVVEETVLLGDIFLNLSDTAGLRDTDDVVEQIGVQRSKKAMDSAELIIAVFDASKPLNDDDFDLIRNLKDKRCIAVINKCDLEKNIDEKYIFNAFENVVVLSAQNDDDALKLEDEIKKVVGIAGLDTNEPILANERQRYCVSQCKSCIDEAIFAVESGMALDAVNVSIDSALGFLLSLTGEKVSDAVVDEVFDKFCVGK